MLAIYKRAAARRRYNMRRQQLKEARRNCVLEYLRYWGLKRGVQAKIAFYLGVDPSVISRDISVLLEEEGLRPTIEKWHRQIMQSQDNS